MATIPEALEIALQHHRAGRLQAAEQIYRQVLQAEPNQADAIHSLGVMAYEAGKHEVAVAWFRRAAELKPDFSGAHNNLGLVLREQGKPDESVACFRRAVELQPDLAEAHNNLGLALMEQGKLEEAITCCRRALELKSDFAEAHNSLGLALKEQGKLEEAVASYRRALELRPDLAETSNDLGVAFQEQGKLEEAAACFHRAVELKPSFAEAHNNLGLVFKEKGKLEEAVGCYRRALKLGPDLAEAHNNLGNALMDRRKLEEAAACFRRALELKPDFAGAHCSLGAAFLQGGILDQAIACFRRAIELKPDLAGAHNNLAAAYKDAGRLDDAIACYHRTIALNPNDDALYSSLLLILHYHPAYTAASIYEEHRRWNRELAAPLRGRPEPFANVRDPDRRLRIGYVSPDFRDHTVGRNILPILERHDRAQLEVFCYANLTRPDAITQRFQAASDVWRNIRFLSDQAAAALIRADRIDILINLALHSAGQRLKIFACKPAPLQVAWAGYPGTTGLDAVDYRLTDPYLDPPGAPTEYFSEAPIRLPHSFWCYDPIDESLPVSPLPALSAGVVTFGSLNNYCKVNEGVIALWSKVLCAVKGSRLLLLSKVGAHRERALKDFERRGVSPDRIEWSTPAPRPEYLAAYHRIDLGLDTFPYNGHTTSLDSFWMGVPIVTLVGGTVVGRAGLSQLTNLGLPELIAYTPDEYVRIAADLAQDLPRLAHLRSTLRERMRASPLMDAPRFARNIEAAYRDMWRRWCAH